MSEKNFFVAEKAILYNFKITFPKLMVCRKGKDSYKWMKVDDLNPENRKRVFSANLFLTFFPSC